VAKLDNAITDNFDQLPRQRKRSRLEIYKDILTALIREDAEHPRPSLTRVANRVNMPYDRLVNILEVLNVAGLCEPSDRAYRVSLKGAEFLTEYRRFSESINRLGIRS